MKTSVSRDGIEIFGVSNEQVEMALCEMYVKHFEEQRANIDNRQLRIRKNSPFADLDYRELQRVGKEVVSVMPLWDYLEIMNGTGDRNFWFDQKNKEKFLKDNPQYAVKNFK